MKIAIDTNVIYDYFEMNKNEGEGFVKDRLEKVLSENEVFLYEGSFSEFVTSNKDRISDIRDFVAKFSINIVNIEDVDRIVNANYEKPNLNLEKSDKDLYEDCENIRCSVESTFLSASFWIVFASWCSAYIQKNSSNENKQLFVNWINSIIETHKKDVFESLLVWLTMAINDGKDCEERKRFWLEYWIYKVISEWEAYVSLVNEGVKVNVDVLEKKIKEEKMPVQKSLRKKINGRLNFWVSLLNKECIDKRIFEKEMGCFSPDVFALPKEISDYYVSILMRISGTEHIGIPEIPKKNDTIDMLIYSMHKDDCFLITRDKRIVDFLSSKDAQYIQKRESIVGKPEKKEKD